MRNLDIETLVEDALLRALPLYIEIDATYTRWEDVKNKLLTPTVRVYALECEPEDGTLNVYAASNVQVTFGVFTSKKIDETGRIANRIRGQIRSMLNRGDIVDIMNNIQGLNVYPHGVIPAGSVNVTDDKIWQKNLTMRIVATTQ